MTFKVERFIAQFIVGAILGALGGLGLCVKLRGWSEKRLIIFTCVGALIGAFVFALSKSPVKIPKDK